MRMITALLVLLVASPALAGDPGTYSTPEKVVEEPLAECYQGPGTQPCPIIAAPPEEAVKDLTIAFELRGAAGSTGMVGGSLYFGEGPIRLGGSLDYLTGDGISCVTTCPPVKHGKKKYHQPVYVTTCKERPGRALALVNVEYVHETESVKPFLGAGIGVLDDDLGWSLRAGILVPISGRFHASLGWRMVNEMHFGVIGIRWGE